MYQVPKFRSRITVVSGKRYLSVCKDIEAFEPPDDKYYIPRRRLGSSSRGIQSITGQRRDKALIIMGVMGIFIIWITHTK